MQHTGLIIIPYAYGGNTGVSIQNVGKQMDIYLKNVCVSAVSAKRNAGAESDIIVVSNIEIPQPYQSILSSNGVLIDNCPFDKFNFGKVRSGKNVRWQLAYYKLCALSHCLTFYKYDYYCFLDTDVFIQGAFDRIWEDARYNIMLYDINAPANGYLVLETRQFLDTEIPLCHYGGEFIAASRELAKIFISECEKVYSEMVNANFISDNGDEFITSIVAYRLRSKVKNAGAYVRRYWTGSWRLICNDYDKSNIVVLHVPAEKEQGIIHIFNKYILKGKVPLNKQVWNMLHLRRPSLRVSVGSRVNKFIGLFRK